MNSCRNFLVVILMIAVHTNYVYSENSTESFKNPENSTLSPESSSKLSNISTKLVKYPWQHTMNSSKSTMHPSKPTMNSSESTMYPSEPTMNSSATPESSTGTFTNYESSTLPSASSTLPSESSTLPSASSSESASISTESMTNSTEPSISSTEPAVSSTEPTVSSPKTPENSTKTSTQSSHHKSHHQSTKKPKPSKGLPNNSSTVTTSPVDNLKVCAQQLINWCQNYTFLPDNTVESFYESNDSISSSLITCVSTAFESFCHNNGAQWFSCFGNKTLLYNGKTMNDTSVNDSAMCIAANTATTLLSNFEYDTISDTEMQILEDIAMFEDVIDDTINDMDSIVVFTK